jgi:hypothetical protein
MGLFKSDLYRNFAIGFLLGAVAVSFQAAPELWQDIAPAAVAQVLR